MRIDISTEEFQALIDKLKNSFNRINSCFNEITNSINLIKNNPDVWDSNTKVQLFEYYNSISELIPLYNNKFDSYIRYLTNIYSSYKVNEIKTDNFVEYLI